MRALFLAVLVMAVPGVSGSAQGATACSPAAGGVVDLNAVGPTPTVLTLTAGQELDFANQSGEALSVTTSADNETAALQPGDCAAFVSQTPGDYTYTVSGYPGGDVIVTLSVLADATVTIAPHASIAYGQRTVISGTASGPANTSVVVSARPLNRSQPIPLAVLTPLHGGWSIVVAPPVATEYTASFGSAQTQRILSVRPDLHVRHAGHTIDVSILARLSHPPVWLFRYTPNDQMLWSGVRSTNADSSGHATFHNVPTGRYYVAVLGNNLYLDNGSEPFQIGH